MTLEQLRMLARIEWGRVTPYRLGRMVGRHVDPVARSEMLSPYKPESRAYRSFVAGVLESES